MCVRKLSIAKRSALLTWLFTWRPFQKSGFSILNGVFCDLNASSPSSADHPFIVFVIVFVLVIVRVDRHHEIGLLLLLLSVGPEPPGPMDVIVLA